MSFSRFGIFVSILLAVFLGTNCGYYNRIIARKNLVDGSEAYKARKFEEAEKLFRAASTRYPEGTEGRMAQLFLARTLHSIFIGNRKEESKAEEAIQEYRKALAGDPNDQSSYKAIASLLENLKRNDEWLEWVTKRSQDKNIAPQHQAEALTSLASKQNTCANEVSDTEATKKTITKDGKPSFQFVKPAVQADFDKMKACIEKGTELINQAFALETPKVKNAATINPESMTDAELKENLDELKVFESARSFKASLLNQSMRMAEMEGRTADRDRLKQESDQTKAAYRSLSDIVQKIKDEIDKRAAEKLAEITGNTADANAAANANAATNANKK